MAMGEKYKENSVSATRSLSQASGGQQGIGAEPRRPLRITETKVRLHTVDRTHGRSLRPGNRVKEVATGIISGCTIDQTGVRQHVRLPVVVVPDFGRIFSSIPSATE